MWVPSDAAARLFDRREEPGWATFATTHTPNPYSAIVTIESRTDRLTREFPLVAATFPMIEILPGGNILVVAPRCAQLGDGIGEKNARIYRADGSSDDLCLGDGINRLQADSRGRIWVGYFDEGVFGNFGWGLGTEHAPLGASGLVCYDPLGRVAWEFQPPEGFDSISDCYALNVIGDDVWACYYTDFPIVRIDSEGRLQGWHTDLRGVTQIAVSDDSVLAFGGYGEHANDCTLLKLRNGRAERIADVKLMVPDSVDLKRSEVVARGARLYVLAADEVFVFAVPTT